MIQITNMCMVTQLAANDICLLRTTCGLGMLFFIYQSRDVIIEKVCLFVTSYIVFCCIFFSVCFIKNFFFLIYSFKIYYTEMGEKNQGKSSLINLWFLKSAIFVLYQGFNSENLVKSEIKILYIDFRKLVKKLSIRLYHQVPTRRN